LKSLVLANIRQIDIRDVRAPEIRRSTDVLIKIKSVGICGSDMHYYSSGRIGSQVVEYPFTPGHEASGIIIETGTAVKSLKKGDRVAIDPAMPCNQCDQCLSGRHHTCRNLKFLGCPGQAEGALSEYLVMPESSCYKIADSLNFDQAVISEPLAIGIYAVRKPQAAGNKKAGILGFGPIGMSVYLAARYYQINDIYVTDRIDERLNIARQLGAKWAGNPDKEDIVKGILEIEPMQLDYIFECCGKQEAADQAIDLLKPGGTLIIIGIPDFDQWSFNVEKTRRKEISIQNIRRQVDCTKLALDLLGDKKINAAPMVTHHFSFGDAEKAFNMVADYEDGVMKAIIEL
jgi:L-iditol 2-dehydrogenase